VWCSVWDGATVADHFAAGLRRVWGARRAASAAGRRFEIVRLAVDGAPGVRLVDAPTGWIGWKHLPVVHLN
jgi:hypothetical protein